MPSLLTPTAGPDSASPAPAVSVAIPALNGGKLLLDLLESLADQDLERGPVELLIADSGSSDGSCEEALRRFEALRLFRVGPGQFDHGAVRTALVREARAPLVALFSQDARPTHRDYLQRLASAFDDPHTAGAWARQVPRAGADPLVEATLLRWTPPASSQIQRLPEGVSWSDLSPGEKMRLARFDNVASMVRREAVVEVPFPDREFGEDLAWGATILQTGRSLAYVSSAVVEHHHTPALVSTFQRHRVAHRQAAGEFGLRAVPSLPALGASLLTGLPQDWRDGGALWAVRGLPRRTAALLGQWIGGSEGRATQ